MHGEWGTVCDDGNEDWNHSIYSPMVDMSMARGLLMLSQKPNLTPTTPTRPMATVDGMARGLLMLSQRPRLIPTTSMATDTQPMAMATTERGLPMLSQRPRLTLTTSMAMDTQLTDMSKESNHQEPKFAYVHIGYQADSLV